MDVRRSPDAAVNGVNDAQLPFSSEDFQRNADTAIEIFFDFSFVHSRDSWAVDTEYFFGYFMVNVFA